MVAATLSFGQLGELPGGLCSPDREEIGATWQADQKRR